MRAVVAAAAAACAAAAPATPLAFSNVFGTHMVLQRGRPIPIWGWATPGAPVLVTFQSQTLKVAADGTGMWKATFAAAPANATGSTATASVPSTGESATLTDVLVGDVILCSGQSNMEFTTNDVVNATAELAAANNYPLIRITSGPLQGKLHLYDILPQPYNNLLAIDLPWSVANNETVGGAGGGGGWDFFSGVCWFSLRDTFDANTARGEANVPLGGIVESYGGTSIQWWSNQDAISSCPAAPGSACCNYGGNNSCLWNSQIYPWTLGPTQLSAVLWLQGEQNSGGGGPPQIPYYQCALPALINSWRDAFQQPQLPFGVILLAPWQANPFDAPYFPLMRLIQTNVSAIPGAFSVSTVDGGQPVGLGPIHSPYKQIPGKRAALALQSFVYGQPSEYRGPRYAAASPAAPAQPGALTVAIAFDPASLYGGALHLNTSIACPAGFNASSCEAFAVQTSGDCAWHASQPSGDVVASLSADGTQLLLTLPSAPAGASIVATRGYFANWPLVQLYSAAAGQPAEPWLANVTATGPSCPGPWQEAEERAAEWRAPASWADFNAHA